MTDDFFEQFRRDEPNPAKPSFLRRFTVGVAIGTIVASVLVGMGWL